MEFGLKIIAVALLAIYILNQYLNQKKKRV